MKGASLSFVRNTLSSGDVTIASVLASVDAMSAEFRSGRVL